MKNIARIAILAFLATVPVHGSVIEFTDRAEWESGVGAFTTLGFVLPPSGTTITGQYSHLGVTFGDFIFSHASGGYVNDGWGMRGAVDGAWVYFDSPQRYFGIDLTGIAILDLYSGDELIHTTAVVGGGGIGFFGGVLSTSEFDTVYIYRPEPHMNIVFIDDVHFGNIVPAPATFGLLSLGGFVIARRRRTSC